MSFRKRLIAVVVLTAVAATWLCWAQAAQPPANPQAAAKLELHKGDRIVLIGDTFAERAALYGYIETLFQCRFPDLQLSFRNLGYSADTVGVHVADMAKGTVEYNHDSNRALNFGPMPKHLADAKADVIFMCFGMADSFAGAAGLPVFTKHLQTLIKAHQAKQYNGKSPPRLVLIGPIAHEKMGGRFPDPTAHNADLKRYSEAMRKVAAENKLPFVDLFTPMQELMAEADLFKAMKAHVTRDKLTINGIHLQPWGYFMASRPLHARRAGRAAAEMADYPGQERPGRREDGNAAVAADPGSNSGGPAPQGIHAMAISTVRRTAGPGMRFPRARETLIVNGEHAAGRAPELVEFRHAPVR